MTVILVIVACSRDTQGVSREADPGQGPTRRDLTVAHGVYPCSQS